jgi:hypothetical protein
MLGLNPRGPPVMFRSMKSQSRLPSRSLLNTRLSFAFLLAAGLVCYQAVTAAAPISYKMKLGKRKPEE